jgi:FlaA1/EpsC-like NDP-sugar epimerase
MPSKRVLITGITGTLGTKLTEKILEAYPDCEIRGISRDEQKQHAFPIKDDRVKLRLADIRNLRSLYRATTTSAWAGFDCIFHLAALKCAPQLEANPSEAIETNINGTQNVLDLAKELDSKVCFTSSDKAVYPINIYGMTKAAGEKLVLSADPDNIVCRYGNVLGSRGSILPSLMKSLKEDRKAKLTDPRMTRFWLPVDKVAEFVMDCGMNESAFPGLCIPEMQSSKVTDLIGAVAAGLGVTAYEIEEIGMLPGEKLHEHLETEYENGRADITSGDPSRLLNQDELRQYLGGYLCTI